MLSLSKRITFLFVGFIVVNYQAISQFENIPQSAWQINCLMVNAASGHVHVSITEGKNLVNSLAQQYGFQVVNETSPSVFTKANLAQYDLILFNNTTKLQVFLNAEQKEALRWYAEEFTGTDGQSQGGVFGWHGATDLDQTQTESYPWWRDWIGGVYNGAGGGNERLTENSVPTDKQIMQRGISNWSIDDEWYQFTDPIQSNQGTTVLYNTGGYGAQIWTNEKKRARLTMTGIGHAGAMFAEQNTINFFTGAILWTSGYGGSTAGNMGCMDLTACNFDPAATTPCNNCCITQGSPSCPTGILIAQSREKIVFANDKVFITQNGNFKITVLDVAGNVIFQERGSKSKVVDYSKVLDRGIFWVRVKFEEISKIDRIVRF